MNRVIRIGTRDSELALWQANAVKQQLDATGYETQLVPIVSTGDLRLDKPLHELGITGIFTKTLDVALIRGEIDIAVHSLKDVPTILPAGIVQAAVLKRGNCNDLLVYKNNEEFLAQKEAVIATGSLRRTAQWLNRYPTHTLVGLRGNVNTRLQKLRDNDWNGAIFAAAGLERIGLKPQDSITLDWMLPAPAQGAIMIAALEKEDYILEACAALNHEGTAICTGIEREFLNVLEGGCTAPIGALAFIRKDKGEVTFKGVLLNRDGTKKIEVTQTAPLGEHHKIARECADIVLKRGGKRLMNELQLTEKQANIFSTKKLTIDQLGLFHDSISVSGEDFIKISPNRIPASVLQSKIQNVIITSKNAVEALLLNLPGNQMQFENIYCVGRKTKRLVEKRIGKVKHVENSARKLADYLVEYLEGLEVTYFCSDLRLDDLPDILAANNIEVHEVETYKTKYAPVKIPESADGVLFFSPSTVHSFLLENKADKIAFCIGETTAAEARIHFKDVRVASLPTAEDLIRLVNKKYDNTKAKPASNASGL